MPQPGDLDTTFDGNGKKQVNFGGRDEPHAVLVQPNGRIVVAGQLEDGTNTNFGIARVLG